MAVPIFNVDDDKAMQSFNAVFCLAGLPPIVAGLWALTNRLEGIIRLYLYYLVLSIALDGGYLFAVLTTTDICASLPPALKLHGSAFACGATRLFVYGFFGAFFAFQAYCVFTVWSLCEAIRGGGDASFADLLQAAEDSRIRNKMVPYGGVLGFETS